MERLLGASRELGEKVDSNEAAAGELLRQCESLQEELRAMRRYRECLQELNGGEQSRVRLPNIEYGYIRQLQQDNSDLRTLLEEHQAALEMIMTKYRQQISTFMNTGAVEGSLHDDRLSEELQQRTDQVYHMATVMFKAARAEDTTSRAVAERLSQLEFENKHLRDLLQFSTPQLLEPNDRSQPSSSSSLLKGHTHPDHPPPPACNKHHPPNMADTSSAPLLSNSVEHSDDGATPTGGKESDSLSVLKAASSRLEAGTTR